MALGLLFTAFFFLGGLALVTSLKVRHAVSMFEWVAGGMDRSTRRLAALAALPSGGLTVWMSVRGLDPPTAFIFGVALGFGVFVASLGIIGLERVLLETESETTLRRSTNASPTTSMASRLGAVSLGVGIIIAVAVIIARSVD